MDTGVPIIDVSKQCLLYVIQQLFQPQVVCGTQGEHCKRIEDTIRLLKRNLTREEQLMEALHYPDIAEHAEDHRNIMNELESYHRQYACSDYDNTTLQNRLLEWATVHTQDFDKRFGDFWILHRKNAAV